MTGVSELSHVRVVSAAPERIRVSVFGGRTQLDIALPLDIPVSGFISELARLVRSRDVPDEGDTETKNERRTFWVLSRFDSGAELLPDQTLREAGVVNGELLRLSAERALSPPTLYDDVVDAAARLNKASYISWDARSARWMSFIAVHLIAVALVVCLAHPVFAEQRWVIAALAGATVVALIGAAAVAQRSYGAGDVAAAIGWAAIPITAGIDWSLLARHGDYWAAAGWAVLPLLCFVYYRVIGSGHWAYIAASMLAGLGSAATLSHAIGARLDAVCIALTLIATLACLAVGRLTSRLGRFPAPTVATEDARSEWDFENPFVSAPTAQVTSAEELSAIIPTAESVWEKAWSAALTRSALYCGLASAATVGAAVLLRSDAGVSWPTYLFALVCAAALGLRSRVLGSWVERAGLAVPALALALTTATLAQNGPAPIPIAALGVLLGIGVLAAVIGLWSAGASARMSAPLAYLEYATVGSLLPLALWALGCFEHLGPWRWR